MPDSPIGKEFAAYVGQELTAQVRAITRDFDIQNAQEEHRAAVLKDWQPRKSILWERELAERRAKCLRLFQQLPNKLANAIAKAVSRSNLS